MMRLRRTLRRRSVISTQVLLIILLQFAALSLSDGYTEIFSSTKDENDNVISGERRDGKFYLSKSRACKLGWELVGDPYNGKESFGVFHDVEVGQRSKFVYAVGGTQRTPSNLSDEAPIMDIAVTMHSLANGELVRQSRPGVREAASNIGAAISFNKTSGDLLMATNSYSVNGEEVSQLEGRIWVLDAQSLAIREWKKVELNFSGKCFAHRPMKDFRDCRRVSHHT